MVDKAIYEYFSTSILILLISFSYGCGENEDFNNLTKIKKGMGIIEVDSIMGIPDSSFVDPDDKGQMKYRYNATFGMSDDMYIYFSLPDSTVKYIYDGR